jgi:Flp pilus assembly protein TadG
MTRYLLECRKGNVASTFAIAMLPIMIGVAGAVDYTMANNNANNVQNALDSSALAAGAFYYSGMTKPQLAVYSED